MRAAIPSARTARIASKINPASAIMEPPKIPFEPHDGIFILFCLARPAALTACRAFFDDAEKNGVYRLFAPVSLETFARAKHGRELGELRFVSSTLHASPFSVIARRGGSAIGWRCIAVGLSSSSRFTRG
jgi:hypothetical protein